ncbi:MAG TPA: pectate lyase [Bacteroidales bacterium]|nr:pectate lyase [Bacteroidales bacterium]
MRKLAILLFFVPFVLQAQQLAFPGAEGFGRFTTGGRGGKVYVVTNLLDSVTKPPEGSLRWAVNKQGPRTIVFAVSGTIELKRSLSISKGDVTIAGQTAPGDGICIKDYVVTVDADNVIIRYMRFRCGNMYATDASQDAFSGHRHKNIIIDHCTMSWSVDEAASFYDNENFTMQWCLISESLNNGGHPKGPHGYGGIWGGMGASFHHNLFASNTSRNPRFCGARYHQATKETELVDFRNNVIFNWGANSSYGGEMGQQNMINNYYKPGPATKKSVRGRILEPFDSLGVWYVDGNYVEGSRAISGNNWNGGVQGDFAGARGIKAAKPFDVAPVKTQSAKNTYKLVVKEAGANLPKRDPVDTRILKETVSGKCTFGGEYGANTGIIDNAANVGGWPELKTYNVKVDSDGDGMPDEWEKASGLDPSNPEDRNNVSDTGYTMLEEYLNSIH